MNRYSRYLLTAFLTCHLFANAQSPNTTVRPFFKKYQNKNFNASPYSVNPFGNQILMVGVEGDDPSQALSTFTILDTTGKVIKSVILTSDEHFVNWKVIPLKDGNFIGCGQLQDNLCLFKFDKLLNIIWTRKILTSRQTVAVGEVMESSEGDIYCYLTELQDPFKLQVNLLKLTATGIPEWYRLYNLGSSYFSSGQKGKIVDAGDHVYLTYAEDGGDWSPIILKVNKSDGSAIWARKYQVPGPFGLGSHSELESFLTNNNNLFLLVVHYEQHVFLSLSLDGNVTKSVINNNKDGYDAVMKWALSGKLLVAHTTRISDSTTVFGQYELDDNLNLVRQQYAQAQVACYLDDLAPYSASLNFAAVTLANLQNYYESWPGIIRFNFESSFNDCDFPRPISFTDFEITISEKDVDAVSLPLPQYESFPVNYSPGTLGFCFEFCAPICKPIKINGPRNLCSGETADFFLEKEATCESAIDFYVDNSTASILNQTDSIVTINFFAPGIHTIKAVSPEGCFPLSDSITVTVHASPAGFLPVDTVMCKSETIVLATSYVYSSYLWSTGSTAPSVIVNEPGAYTLSVTDVNSCTGTATTVVTEKACLNGFYIPTAFTPNGDGKNDVFRPLLFGNVTRFKFCIYNRWGQLVYQTTDPGAGWDGRLSGSPQGTFLFVWTCNYKLEGEPEKFEKGHVTLIR